MRIAEYAFVFLACTPTHPAQPDATLGRDATLDAGNAPDATSDATSAPPLAGWIHPARRTSAKDPGTPTTLEAFSRAHAATKSTPDAACWSGQTNLCTCDRAIAIDLDAGTVDVLVCKRFIEGSAGSPIHILTRSVLYTVERGALKLVLDVPSAATVEAEDTDTGSIVGSVSLRPIPSRDGVVFADEWESDTGPWCPQAVARAGGRQDKAWTAIHKAYTEACTTSGRWKWVSGRLVR
jgi:hypothetical protein